MRAEGGSHGDVKFVNLNDTMVYTIPMDDMEFVMNETLLKLKLASRLKEASNENK